MEPVINTGLPVHLLRDPDDLAEVIIDEIERSLPEIIASLNMPEPLDALNMHVIQLRLRSGRGFRPLTSTQRERSIRQLKDDAFLRNLKKVQELTWSDLDTGNPKIAAIPGPLISSEATTIHNWEEARSVEATVVNIEDATKSEVVTGGSFRSASGIDARASKESAEEWSTGAVLLPDEEDLLKIPTRPIELEEPLSGRDVHGLVAVLKQGRLVTFIETGALNLIPKDVEAIPVPDRKVFRGLSLEDLMSEYHDLVTARSDAKLRELRLLDALIISLENEAQWSRINKRRFHLITKKHSLGLDPAEDDEFSQLQRLADMHADAVQPIPFSNLAMLRDYARKLGFDEGLFAK